MIEKEVQANGQIEIRGLTADFEAEFSDEIAPGDRVEIPGEFRGLVRSFLLLGPYWENGYTPEDYISDCEYLTITFLIEVTELLEDPHGVKVGETVERHHSHCRRL
jgi:hypothetical protein